MQPSKRRHDSSRSPLAGCSSILVRGTNWLGDSVMSVAALKELRRIHPNARLALICKESVAGLFHGQPFLDEVLTYAEDTMSMRQVVPRIRKFQAAVLFQNAFRSALWAYAARTRPRIGYATQSRSWLLTDTAVPRIRSLQRHQVYYYLDLLYQSGISDRCYLEDASFRPDIRIAPTGEGRRNARALLQEAGVSDGSRLVLINPGATFGPAKRWFLVRYAELADTLVLSEGLQVAFIGSRSEEGLAREIASRMRAPAAVLSGRTSIPSLIALMSMSRLLVTNDSGPMHVGAAVGIPLVALFGSTDEVATGPFSSQADVIHKHVECSPCLLRECPIDLRCFERIRTGEVLEIVRGRLKRTEQAATS